MLRLVRGDAEGVDDVHWDPDAGTIDAARLEGVDAVVHLAGAGIGDKKWSPGAQAARPRQPHPRHRPARAHARRARPAPSVLVSGSAIGYYGNRGDEILTEESGPGHDFLARGRAGLGGVDAAGGGRGHTGGEDPQRHRARPHGGVLKRLLLPFKLGLGGRVGSGEQYMSWITLDDEVGAIAHAIATDALAGPGEPHGAQPGDERRVHRALGDALHRPTLIPTPLTPLKLVYGGRARAVAAGRRSARVVGEARIGRVRLPPPRDRARVRRGAARASGRLTRRPASTMSPVRLWIDTDVGDDPDDVVALLCAAAHPDVELVGVSIVPDLPIVRPDLAAELVAAPVHGGGDVGALAEAFVDAAPDALLAIGPLGNVAALVDAGIDLPEMTVMGGVLTPLRHRGRVWTAEHNFAMHPAAAARVVAETDAVIVPLDATLHMRVAPAELDRLTSAVPAPRS